MVKFYQYDEIIIQIVNQNKKATNWSGKKIVENYNYSEMAKISLKGLRKDLKW